MLRTSTRGEADPFGAPRSVRGTTRLRRLLFGRAASVDSTSCLFTGINRPSLLGTKTVRSAARGRSSPGPGRGSHHPSVAGTRAVPVTPSLLCRCRRSGPGPDQRNGRSIYRCLW